MPLVHRQIPCLTPTSSLPWLADSCLYADAELTFNENGSRGTMLCRVAMQSCYEKESKIPQRPGVSLGAHAEKYQGKPRGEQVGILVAVQFWYRHSAKWLAHGEDR